MRNYLKIITARFNSTCNETGRDILKGDICLYDPNARKVYHDESKTMLNFRNAEMDEKVLMPQFQDQCY